MLFILFIVLVFLFLLMILIHDLMGKNEVILFAFRKCETITGMPMIISQIGEIPIKENLFSK